MSPMAIGRQLSRGRGHLMAIAAVLALGGAVAGHHSGVPLGDLHGDMGMDAAIEMCVGTLTAIGAAVIAVAFGLIGLGRWRPSLFVAPLDAALAAGPPIPRARAGPSLLCVLCVSRR